MEPKVKKVFIKRSPKTIPSPNTIPCVNLGFELQNGKDIKVFNTCEEDSKGNCGYDHCSILYQSPEDQNRFVYNLTLSASITSTSSTSSPLPIGRLFCLRFLGLYPHKCDDKCSTYIHNNELAYQIINKYKDYFTKKFPLFKVKKEFSVSQVNNPLSTFKSSPSVGSSLIKKSDKAKSSSHATEPINPLLIPPKDGELTLNALPSDVIRLIFCWIPTEDKLKYRIIRVCKKLYQALTPPFIRQKALSDARLTLTQLLLTRNVLIKPQNQTQNHKEKVRDQFSSMAASISTSTGAYLRSADCSRRDDTMTKRHSPSSSSQYTAPPTPPCRIDVSVAASVSMRRWPCSASMRGTMSTGGLTMAALSASNASQKANGCIWLEPEKNRTQALGQISPKKSSSLWCPRYNKLNIEVEDSLSSSSSGDSIHSIRPSSIHSVKAPRIYTKDPILYMSEYGMPLGGLNICRDYIINILVPDFKVIPTAYRSFQDTSCVWSPLTITLKNPLVLPNGDLHGHYIVIEDKKDNTIWDMNDRHEALEIGMVADTMIMDVDEGRIAHIALYKNKKLVYSFTHPDATFNNKITQDFPLLYYFSDVPFFKDEEEILLTQGEEDINKEERAVFTHVRSYSFPPLRYYIYEVRVTQAYNTESRCIRLYTKRIYLIIY